MAWMAWMAWLVVFLALCADAKPRELFEVGPEDQETGLEPFYDGNMATWPTFAAWFGGFCALVCHMSGAAHLRFSCRILLYLLSLSQLCAGYVGHFFTKSCPTQVDLC